MMVAASAATVTKRERVRERLRGWIGFFLMTLGCLSVSEDLGFWNQERESGSDVNAEPGKVAGTGGKGTGDGDGDLMESAAEIGAVVDGDSVGDAVVFGVPPGGEVAAILDHDAGGGIGGRGVAPAEGEEKMGGAGDVVPLAMPFT